MENEPNFLFAGKFVPRPFLDRLNPFTPIGAKKFIPSSEAQLLLDEYSKKIGRQMHVVPFTDKHIEEAKDAYGPDFSPKAKFSNDRPNLVYLSEDSPIPTLVHELEHALDPNLANKNVRRLKKEYEAGVPIADDFGDRVADDDGVNPWMGDTNAIMFGHESSHPLHTYKAELLAEKAASDYVRSKGGTHRPINLYPKTYLDKFIRDWKPYDKTEDDVSQYLLKEAQTDMYEKAQNIYNNMRGEKDIGGFYDKSPALGSTIGNLFGHFLDQQK